MIMGPAAQRLRQPDPFVQAQERDPRGHIVQLALLCWFVGMLPFGTAPIVVLSIIVMGYVLLRLWATYRAVGTLIHQPILWVLVALVSVHLLSLLWSRDAGNAGLDELQTFRLQIPFLIAFWPLHRESRKLVWALGIGVGLMAIVQLLQLATGGNHYPMYFWWHEEVIPDRYPGMLHPNSTAIIAMTALLTLPAVMGKTVRRNAKIFGTILVIAAAISIILTGSRSEWIASAAGVVIWPVALWRMQRGNRLAMTGRADRQEVKRDGRRMWLALASVVLVVFFGAFLARNLVETRIEDAISEMRSMTTSGDVSTDVGSRLNQFIISAHLVAEHPLIGIGVGSYAIEARAWLEKQQGIAPSDKADHDAAGGQPKEKLKGYLEQPHSTLLYEFDSLGLLGGIVFMSLWVVMVFQCTERQPDGRYSCMVYLPAVVGLMFANALDMHWTTSPGNLVIMLVILLIMHDQYESASPQESRA